MELAKIANFSTALKTLFHWCKKISYAIPKGKGKGKLKTLFHWGKKVSYAIPKEEKTAEQTLKMYGILYLSFLP